MDLERRVKQLIYPCNTHMDLNIGMAFHAAATANNAYLRSYSASEFAASKIVCDGSGRPLVRWGGEDAAKSVGRRSTTATNDVDATSVVEATDTNSCRYNSKTTMVPNPCGNSGCFRVVPKKGCIRGFCKKCCNAYENAVANEDEAPTSSYCPVHKSRAAIADAAQQISTTASSTEDVKLPSHEKVEAVKIPYECACRALLIGIGADEQCAGN